MKTRYFSDLELTREKFNIRENKFGVQDSRLYFKFPDHQKHASIVSNLNKKLELPAF